MKIILLTIITSVGLSLSLDSTSLPKLNDAAETFKIGKQIWMAENLKVSTFKNGDTIIEAKTEEDWFNAGKNKQPCWCYFENDSLNNVQYGKLYNWYAVTDPRGLAPMGWHIPSEKEWSDLIDFIEPQPETDTFEFLAINFLPEIDTAGFLATNFGVNAAPKMKSVKGWEFNTGGNNESGFNGLPGGFRDDQGQFYGIGYASYW